MSNTRLIQAELFFRSILEDEVEAKIILAMHQDAELKPGVSFLVPRDRVSFSPRSQKRADELFAYVADDSVPVNFGFVINFDKPQEKKPTRKLSETPSEAVEITVPAESKSQTVYQEIYNQLIGAIDDELTRLQNPKARMNPHTGREEALKTFLNNYRELKSPIVDYSPCLELINQLKKDSLYSALNKEKIRTSHVGAFLRSMVSNLKPNETESYGKVFERFKQLCKPHPVLAASLSQSSTSETLSQTSTSGTQRENQSLSLLRSF